MDPFLKHLESLWLFTFSDLKTIVGPKAFFGTVNALAVTAFELELGDQPTSWDILRRIPTTIIWIWINLLPFNVDNQRQLGSIIEDRVNKPWRPIPSRRVTPERAKKWMFCLYIVALLASKFFGGFQQSLVLLFLGLWYNDFGGADVHCLLRNLINALGFVCYASGAMEVALSKGPLYSRRLSLWFLTVGLVVRLVLTSVHSQDMADQKGDRLRGRKSVPLTIGDIPSRWTIAISVLALNDFGDP